MLCSIGSLHTLHLSTGNLGNSSLVNKSIVKTPIRKVRLPNRSFTGNIIPSFQVWIYSNCTNRKAVLSWMHYSFPSTNGEEQSCIWSSIWWQLEDMDQKHTLHYYIRFEKMKTFQRRRLDGQLDSRVSLRGGPRRRIVTVMARSGKEIKNKHILFSCL